MNTSLYKSRRRQKTIKIGENSDERNGKAWHNIFKHTHDVIEYDTEPNRKPNAIILYIIIFYHTTVQQR